MNLRTIERSVKRYMGTPRQPGPERGTTGEPKGAAEAIRPGFRDNLPGKRRRLARSARVRRVTLPAMELRRPSWRDRIKATARNVASAVRSFARRVAP